MDITAHVAGIVREIAVQSGQQVDEGDEIIVLEAMKMHLPLASRKRGVVTAVLVQPGELVQVGQVLVVLS